jgi:hypothetical protein
MQHCLSSGISVWLGDFFLSSRNFSLCMYVIEEEVLKDYTAAGSWEMQEGVIGYCAFVWCSKCDWHWL